MTIAIYGASGYTGKLVASELHSRGMKFVLCGRNRDRDRLYQAASAVGATRAERRVASVDDPHALRAAFAGGQVVINHAGPFSFHGEPVVRAAIAVGAHYLDTAGEQLYIQRIFDRCSADAENAGVTVVLGMGYDTVPGDLALSEMPRRTASALQRNPKNDRTATMMTTAPTM